MKGVQCYELFGGIALKNHTFSFSFHFTSIFVSSVGSYCRVVFEVRCSMSGF